MKHTAKQVPNEFAVEGQIVKMTVMNKKGKEYVTTFDVKDLDKVKAAGQWYAQWHKDYNAYFVQSNSKPVGKEKPKKQSLHHFLMDQPSYVSIIHLSGDTLDNRNENLKLYNPNEKNEIEHLDNGVVSITLKNKLGQIDGHALISEGDLALVTQEPYVWVCQKKHNGQRYAVANTPQGRIYLDKLIMEPSETQYVYHINKNRLDNRRPNLELKEIELDDTEVAEA